MWLLSTGGVEPRLQSFASANSHPEYAILSHTWFPSESEVTFVDIMSRSSSAKKKSGWSKVEQARKKALEHCFDWIWIDTCCIDKTSSAELTEAINSMFAWYRDSAACYVYLSDLFCPAYERRGLEQQFCSLPLDEILKRFDGCKWFTRGWTLQEIIAPCPSLVYFFSNTWTSIGTLKELGAAIAHKTGIQAELFRSNLYPAAHRRQLTTTLQSYSIAQRMAWASDRNTTRVEDIAYCLLGVFDVTMPVIYGEGLRAFNRLQQAIMQQHQDDHSILVWGVGHRGSGKKEGQDGHLYFDRLTLLARSPMDFRGCADVVPMRNRKPYELANNGMFLYVRMIGADTCLLACKTQGRLQCFALVLEPTPMDPGEYLVKSLVRLDAYRQLVASQEVKIKVRFWPYESGWSDEQSEVPSKMLVRVEESSQNALKFLNTKPSSHWTQEDSYFSLGTGHPAKLYSNFTLEVDILYKPEGDLKTLRLKIGDQDSCITEITGTFRVSLASFSNPFGFQPRTRALLRFEDVQISGIRYPPLGRMPEFVDLSRTQSVHTGWRVSPRLSIDAGLYVVTLVDEEVFLLELRVNKDVTHEDTMDQEYARSSSAKAKEHTDSSMPSPSESSLSTPASVSYDMPQLERMEKNYGYLIGEQDHSPKSSINTIPPFDYIFARGISMQHPPPRPNSLPPLPKQCQNLFFKLLLTPSFQSKLITTLLHLINTLLTLPPNPQLTNPRPLARPNTLLNMNRSISMSTTIDELMNVAHNDCGNW